MAFTEQYLPESTRNAIHDFALRGRELLTREARDLLEGVYGLHSDGSLEKPESLPTLKDPETREIYGQLIRYLDEEVNAGLERKEAVEKLVKEIAFTHLNRLVAFKMMEERKLIRETVRRGHQSNGFKFYLADHPEEEALFNQGKNNIAYRHFLTWQSSQVAGEIAVLFDVETLPSQLFPRPTSLTNFLSMLNDEILAPAWQVEETIGWIYQYFNEPELQAAFAAVRLSGQKFEAGDIPAATQLFTLDWVVHYLVENTLGQLWIQLHPDSQLSTKLEYFINLPGESGTKPLRLAKEITLLDPACGSMHFGLVAFDLFAAMYQEELANIGKPGWPKQPSVSTEDEIPEAIIKNNIFGIDIDLRAVQLSALALYLRAKRMNKNAQIKDHNLSCADVLPFSSADLGRFIIEMKFSNPIFEKMLRRIKEQLEDIDQLGSLLRIERDIHDLVESERQKHDRYRQAHLLPGLSAPSLFPEMDDDATETEYWGYLENQLIQALDFFRKESANRGVNVRFFTQEASKGFRFLDMTLRQYDVVVTNPPYLSRRKMNDTLAKLLDDQYPEGKGDLYAAFIMRALELVKDDGWVGMLTMHSFMFISSYESLREFINSQAAIKTLAHFGPGLFATGNPGTLQTAAFILRREPDTQKREASEGIYFRLVHEPDADSKRVAFEKALAELKQVQSNH